ncbi:RrF2 family transcriptional regulator [Novosphingobium lentum]|uniref:RrF2 family transcriptional regulator n=1 Tax=Novosphingobium lentum TaxID=145287 RepID=UPI000AC0E48E|nr:Rrf2 family transcriptional regulator [Novosphingobium lentum]
MQLTQHTDLGLRLLIVLARRDGVPIALPAFASEQGLSYHHVAKVAQRLVQEGFVTSLRGRRGGVALARPADAIAIGDVVRRMERGLRLADCAHCALRGDCTLSSVLAEALAAFLAVLDRHMLADIAKPGAPAFAPWRVIPALDGTCTPPGD